MTCEHQHRLIDLVYGELTEPEASELRRQAEGCPECGSELARLEEAKQLADALPLEPLPSRSRAAILAAAREAAKEAETARPPVLLRLVRSRVWPPLAMAAVVLLVVVVGVSYSPEQEANELLPVVPEPSPTAEVGPAARGATTTVGAVPPSPAGAPAAPSPEASSAPAMSPRAGASPAPSMADEQGATPARRPRGPRERTRASTARRQRAAATRSPGAAPAPSTATLAERDSVRDAPTVGGTPPPSVEAPAAPLAAAPSAVRARRRPAAPTGGLPAEERRADTASEGWGVRSAGAGAAQTEAEIAEAPRSARAEARAPEPAPMPEVLLRLARSHRARGACATAVSHYADLRRRYPGDPTVPQALLEEADCRRRLGQLTQARALLRQAADYRSTQAVALRELRRVETALRAQTGAASSPAEEAAAAEAAH